MKCAQELYYVKFKLECLLYHRYGDVLTDEDGLPLVYDSEVIGQYWEKRPREVNGIRHALDGIMI